VGMENLDKHVENIQMHGVPVVVAINYFLSDTRAEIDLIKDRCEKLGIPWAVTEVWEKGGEGGLELADQVCLEIEKGGSDFKFLYDVEESVTGKIEKIACSMYGAGGVEYTTAARRNIQSIEKFGMGNLPVCMAKTQFSLTDTQSILGRPRGFKITVREVKPSAGAGFLVVFTGDIMTMPGLPKRPAAENIGLDKHGRIYGLF
jgi:formate--tetrahydrofolate ligase